MSRFSTRVEEWSHRQSRNVGIAGMGGMFFGLGLKILSENLFLMDLYKVQTGSELVDSYIKFFDAHLLGAAYTGEEISKLGFFIFLTALGLRRIGKGARERAKLTKSFE